MTIPVYLSMREQALYVIATVKHCGLWVEAEAAMVAMEGGKLVSDIPVSDAMAMVWSKVQYTQANASHEFCNPEP